MSDPLDRAVDARIDDYRPDTLPPFDVIESRKRSRDRRRTAVGAGALSVGALAAAGVVVPALSGGGDRLTPEVPARDSGAAGNPVTFVLSYDRATEYRLVEDQAAAEECLSLPGTSDRQADYSLPPAYYVTVTGADQVSAFKECAEALPGVIVRTVPAAGGQMRTFRVSSDGTADPAAYTAAVEKCLALPGVSGSSVQESYPATYEMRAVGAAADALAECLGAAPGAGVEETGDSPASLAVGGTATHSMLTHCGVESARINGRWWNATAPLYGSGGAGTGPPDGWGDPFQKGTLTLQTEDSAVFEALGQQVVLKPSPTDEPIRICR